MKKIIIIESLVLAVLLVVALVLTLGKPEDPRALQAPATSDAAATTRQLPSNASQPSGAPDGTRPSGTVQTVPTTLATEPTAVSCCPAATMRPM